MEKLEHYRYILFELRGVSSGGGQKHSMRTMPSERVRQENGFLVLRRIVLTLATPTFRKTSGFDEDRLHTLRGAMAEISNFYNFLPRLFIFGTHIPPIITIHAAKCH